MSDDIEQRLRIRLMEADIELKNAQASKSKQDWRLDPTRVIIQASIASATCAGAIVALLSYLLQHRS